MSDCTQFIHEARYQIEALLKAGHRQSGIATVLNRDKSTISREVGRNRGLRGYRPKQAQRLALAPARPGPITEVLLKALGPHAELVHTLTYDNGKEFAYHQTVAEALDAQGCFAHSCHSWERGLNENTNGLIRQYQPKGSDFHSLPHTQVRSIMDKLNNRSRKCLGFKTPNQLFSGINPPVALTS